MYIDLDMAQRWLYPLNHRKPDYQLEIIRHTLFRNTLVALSSPLDRIFIQAVVMLNCLSLLFNSFLFFLSFFC